MNNIFLMEINEMVIRIPQFLCQVLDLNNSRNISLQELRNRMFNNDIEQQIREMSNENEIHSQVQNDFYTFRQKHFIDWTNIDESTRNSVIIFLYESIGNALELNSIPLKQSLAEQSYTIIARMINFVGNNNMTLLNMASIEYDISLVSFLLKNGANPNLQNNQGNTPLHNAITFNNSDIVQLLINSNAININNVNNWQQAPLHFATSFGNLELTTLLLQKGANPNLRDNQGNTPLHNATILRRIDLVQALIGSVVTNINALNNTGQSPLHIASKNNDLSLTTLLLENGANVNLKNNQGETPLHIASRNSSVELGQLLIDSGANVNVQNTYNSTPIISAVIAKNSEMIKLLISKGVNINAQNIFNGSALSSAILNDDIETLIILLNNNVNINIKTYGELSVIRYAQINNKEEIANLLIKYKSKQELEKKNMQWLSKKDKCKKNKKKNLN